MFLRIYLPLLSHGPWFRAPMVPPYFIRVSIAMRQRAFVVHGPFGGFVLHGPFGGFVVHGSVTTYGSVTRRSIGTIIRIMHMPNIMDNRIMRPNCKDGVTCN